MSILKIILIIFSVIVLTKAGLKKCCPKNHVVLINKENNGLIYTCVNHASLDFQDVKIYKIIGGQFKETGKNLMQQFDVEIVKNFSGSQSHQLPPHFGIYLIENGTMYIKPPKGPISALESDFCVDHYRIGDKTRQNTTFWILNEPEKKYSMDWKGYAMTTAMFVTAFCLGLVLVVFAILPRLRTVGGYIQMFFCGSLMMAYIFFGTLNILTEGHFTSLTCKTFTYAIYFFMLAYCFWMNVMSFDIWRCFSHFDQISREMEPNAKRTKLILYSLYAWAIPLVMTIGMAVVNELDPQIEGFVTPEVPSSMCFLAGQAKMLYLHVPMLILLSLNWVLFFLTLRIVLKLKRGSSRLGRKRKYGFMDYIKLSMVMGLSWVLEVASVLYPDSPYWYLSDTYNALVGVFLFILFVCNQKVWRLLRKKFSKAPPGHPTKNDRSSRTTETSDSQLNNGSVSQNPMGGRY